MQFLLSLSGLFESAKFVTFEPEIDLLEAAYPIKVSCAQQT